MAERQAGLVVQGEDGVAGEPLEQPLLHHHAAAALALLGGLEDEVDGALEVAGLRQVLRGAQQHGGVAVMAAGMHLAVVGGAMGERVALLDRQRIHVGAEADAAGRVAAPDGADDAGLGEAAMHLAAELLELGGDEVGRAALLESELGMGVDVAAEARQFRLKLEDAGDEGHGDSLRGGGTGGWDDRPQGDDAEAFCTRRREDAEDTASACSTD